MKIIDNFNKYIRNNKLRFMLFITSNLVWISTLVISVSTLPSSIQPMKVAYDISINSFNIDDVFNYCKYNENSTTSFNTIIYKPYLSKFFDNGMNIKSYNKFIYWLDHKNMYETFMKDLKVLSFDNNDNSSYIQEKEYEFKQTISWFKNSSFKQQANYTSFKIALLFLIFAMNFFWISTKLIRGSKSLLVPWIILMSLLMIASIVLTVI